uniref:Uncharacterized protein n=1 Tax=Tanacetum cinerariifolium TaxID=118510 RepID=A0A6L2MKW3_TANCI|nr:hypothetical protein [Tanacetum cinerariifolium]
MSLTAAGFSLYCGMKLCTASTIVDVAESWNTAISKTVNSIKQIHAIVNEKAVVISESSVRSGILFNDEDGIACLTNAEIFENLALMGYEQISTKLTFQKGSFSPQWKFLIHVVGFPAKSIGSSNTDVLELPLLASSHYRNVSKQTTRSLRFWLDHRTKSYPEHLMSSESS